MRDELKNTYRLVITGAQGIRRLANILTGYVRRSLLPALLALFDFLRSMKASVCL